MVLFLLTMCFSALLKGQTTFYQTDSIQEIRIYFEQSNWRHLLDSLFQNYGEDGRMPATVKINGQAFPHAGVRYKGFSSYDDEQIKNPFNIDLDYAFEDQNYQGFTKIKLSNVIHDPSFIREVLAYEIARDYMPASRANFANVYVNDTLIGLYTNVEAVDKKFISQHFPSNSNTFFKGSPAVLQYPFGQNSNLALTHGTDSMDYSSYYKLESLLGWSDIYRFIEVLNTDTSHITNVLNVDRALWMHAFNYSMVNLDSYIAYSQNYYMYEDDNGCFNTIPWDLNMSFGSFRLADGTLINLTISKVKQLNPLQHLYSTAYSPRPLMKNLFANDRYRKMYMAHLRTIIDEQFRNGDYLARAQEMQNSIADAVALDSCKFYSDADFFSNLSITTGPASDQYPGIQDLMEARIAYLDTFPGFNGAPELSLPSFTPERPALNETCKVQCKVMDATEVFVFYRFNTNGLFMQQTMFDDGTHDDGLAGDSVFGASLVTSGDIVQYYFYAENDSAGQFFPERAQYEFLTVYPAVEPGKFVLNEIMLLNTTVADQDGEYDAWLELFNASNETLNAGGLQLKSSEYPEVPVIILPDTLVPAGSYLTLWLDGQSIQSGLHTELTIGTSGWITISSVTTEAVVDSLHYGIQSPNRSYGSWPNGSGQSRYLTPTFSACNKAAFTNTYNFSVYPNPANDQLYVEALYSDGVESLEIFNMNLQCVICVENPFSGYPSSAALAGIDVSKLNPGLYVIKVNRETQTELLKIIIAR